MERKVGRGSECWEGCKGGKLRRWGEEKCRNVESYKKEESVKEKRIESWERGKIKRSEC
jgi:hypothetical protein